MIERTDEEITAKVQELWPDLDITESRWSSHDYFVIERADGHIDLTVTAMHDAPGLTFDQINGLAQFFDTMKVETEEEITEGGCESCDYGSRRGVILRISPGDSYAPTSASKEL
ncbi:MAG: hypothetical protein RB191_19885 [Terriglobia bacterium]|nr:hypothetical protein [Terriglobia bacterium]